MLQLAHTAIESSQNNDSTCKLWQNNAKADERVLSLASVLDKKHDQLCSLLLHFLFINHHRGQTSSNLQFEMKKKKKDSCNLHL